MPRIPVRGRKPRLPGSEHHPSSQFSLPPLQPTGLSPPPLPRSSPRLTPPHPAHSKAPHPHHNEQTPFSVLDVDKWSGKWSEHCGFLGVSQASPIRSNSRAGAWTGHKPVLRKGVGELPVHIYSTQSCLNDPRLSILPS